MKNLLIICNVLFLLFGNIAFSNIHYLHEHSHHDQTHECVECTIIENSENYTLDLNVNYFYSNDYSQLIIQENFVIISSKKQTFSSRAPPIS
tara:strand:- start:2825 stop:3100 length:276 start_codon:yes stop_codon:yes gene_type:complete